MQAQGSFIRPATRIEVWAQLFLCNADSALIWDMLTVKCGIKRNVLVPKMHITIYHARRPMQTLRSCTEAANVLIPTAETRFMVLAPGGENPRPELEPRKKKVGIRVQRKNDGRPEILKFRERLLAHETPEVLGGRRPSTHGSNAFGARNFQPHMALLRPGNGVDRDLTILGNVFRQEIKSLTFDRFCIEIVNWDVNGNRILL